MAGYQSIWPGEKGFEYDRHGEEPLLGHEAPGRGPSSAAAEFQLEGTASREHRVKPLVRRRRPTYTARFGGKAFAWGPADCGRAFHLGQLRHSKRAVLERGQRQRRAALGSRDAAGSDDGHGSVRIPYAFGSMASIVSFLGDRPRLRQSSSATATCWPSTNCTTDW